MFLRRVADAAPCRALIAESFARVLLGQGQLHRAKKELCGIRPEGILAAARVSNRQPVPIRVSVAGHPQMVLVLNRVGRSALVQHGAEGKRKSQRPCPQSDDHDNVTRFARPARMVDQAT